MKYEEKLEKLQEYYHEIGIFPNYEGIGDLIGVRSKNAVFKFVQRMIKDNYVQKVQYRIAPLDKFFIWSKIYTHHRYQK